jgi:acetolactate synthase-1/2/3 large subunit
VELNGGSLLARSLAEVAPVVFALHGGHLDSFFMGCQDAGIDLLDFRHEAAAVNAADAYARLTGGLGVAAVTSGPGFTNSFAGLSNAYADGIPLLLITSSPPLRESETNELQGGLDQIAIARPVTKWAHRITTPERIPDLLGIAVRHALSGKPGPVMLELPIDVAFTPVSEDRLTPAGPPTIGRRAAPPADIVAELLAMLRGAERPAIIAGEGTLWMSDRDVVVRFAEASGIPIFHSGYAQRGLPTEHPLNGRGVAGLAVLPFIGVAPDVVVLLGAPPGISLGGRQRGVVPADAAVIQVDVDAAEIGRLYPVKLGVNADPGETVAALLAADDGKWPDWTQWAKQATSGWQMVEAMVTDPPVLADGRLHPYWASKEVLAALPADTTVVIDGGEIATWASTAYAAAPAKRAMNAGRQGHLGIGTGFCIGVHRAEPDSRVVQITGDGAVGFHIQELDTMVRHQLPIVTVVMSNNTWGMSIQGQHVIFGPDTDIISRLAPTAYDKVAEAFGAHGEHVDRIEDIGPAVRRALASGKPALINVTISNDVMHPATRAMLGDMDVVDEIIVPYYQNIPR